jgi:hypothetical protein
LGLSPSPWDHRISMALHGLLEMPVLWCKVEWMAVKQYPRCVDVYLVKQCWMAGVVGEGEAVAAMLCLG